MKSELVSVVIPCYNQAQFLPQAIESVLAQTYQLLEIIVVDDGSTDTTAHVAGSYPRVRYIKQRNQGLSAARNTGLRASKGNYLVFLDADDRLLSHATESALNLFDSHPDCVLVSGRAREIAVDGSPHPTPEHPLIEKEHYFTLLQYCYICTSGAVMFRKEIFESVRAYNPSLRATGDYDLYFRITREYPVYDSGLVIAEYRRHTEQMTCDAALMLKECVRVLRSQRQFVKANTRYTEALERGIRVMQGFYGEPLVEQVRGALRAGKWQKALRGSFVLARYWPQGIVKHCLHRQESFVRTKGDTDHDTNP